LSKRENVCSVPTEGKVLGEKLLEQVKPTLESIQPRTVYLIHSSLNESKARM
jgi:hypothetical protein